MTDAEFKAWEDLSKQSAWKKFGKRLKYGKKIIDAAVSLR